MLIKPLPGHQEAFLENLAGMSILLIGAGGAARAVAVFLAEAIGPGGRVFICNRTEGKALELIGVLTESGACAEYVEELDITEVVEGVDIIVNSTTKGQSGLRIMGEGSVTSLEAYSALGPASPAVIPEPEMEERKKLGIRVIIFLSVLTILLAFIKRKVWEKLK